jgi:type II secretory pathway component GspD/PulD (secretin)
MMGSEDPNKTRNNSRGSFGYFFTPPSQNENEDKRPFKVDADIENNRLLVWANPVEMQEIRQLLIKMGETPPGMSNPETVRTLQLDSDAEADRLLQRLQQVWPEIHSNPLRIQAPTPALPRKSSPPRDVTPPTTHIPAQPASPAAKLTVRYAWWQNGQDPVSSGLHPLAEETSTATDPERGADAGGHLPEDSSRRSADTGGVLPSGSAPIAIERSPMGGLILGSSDTAALDRLEEMIEQLAPPSRDYKVFQLRYPNTWAYGVELNLKAFFKDTSSEQQVRDPFWGYSYTVRNNEGRRMSRQKELKIISDDDSHTILVQGATPQQLLTIADLIEIYDRPTSSDPSAVRHTRIIRLKYSQAEAMAETVKQVYRDLLSANDPALRDPNPNNGKEKAVTERIYSYRMSDDGEGSSSTPPQQPMKFKGMLSVGVDEISNSVAISAGQSLLQEIEEMITLLDEAANPHTHVQVMQVQNLDTTALKERLDKTFTPSVKVSETGRRRNRQSVPQPPPAAPVRNDD